jgi:hypothetical protein
MIGSMQTKGGCRQGGDTGPGPGKEGVRELRGKDKTQSSHEINNATTTPHTHARSAPAAILNS